MFWERLRFGGGAKRVCGGGEEELATRDKERRVEREADRNVLVV